MGVYESYELIDRIEIGFDGLRGTVKGAEVDREMVYEVYVGVCAWYSIGMLTHSKTSRTSAN